MTAVKRRYRTEQPEHKIYSDAFDRLVLQSQILNSGAHALNVHTVLWDRNAIESHLREIAGDETGQYRTINNQMVASAISQAQANLEKLAASYESYKKRRVQEGYPMPITEPPEIFEARLRCEAKLDCAKREAEYLRAQLAKITAKEEVVNTAKVLAYGPQGNGRLHGGVLAEIDGQRVELVDGVLVITEPSLYNGLSCLDYREFVVKPYNESRFKKNQQLKRQRANELAETGFANTVIPSRINKVGRGSLPPFPQGCKNYLIKEATEQQ